MASTQRCLPRGPILFSLLATEPSPPCSGDSTIRPPPRDSLVLSNQHLVQPAPEMRRYQRTLEEQWCRGEQQPCQVARRRPCGTECLAVFSSGEGSKGGGLCCRCTRMDGNRIIHPTAGQLPAGQARPSYRVLLLSLRGCGVQSTVFTISWRP